MLKECGIPAVFFIPTDFVDRPRLPWWDRIAFAVKQSGVDVIEMDFPERVTFDLRTVPRRRIVKGVLDLYKRHVGCDETTFISHLEQRANVSLPPHLVAHRWIVTWNEIREMVAAGMSIGSHTHTHGILGGMDETTQTRELQESKTILERETGQSVTTLAYPVGSTMAFNDTTKAASPGKSATALLSPTTGGNWAGPTDPFDIRRVGVVADRADVTFPHEDSFQQLVRQILLTRLVVEEVAAFDSGSPR